MVIENHKFWHLHTVSAIAQQQLTLLRAFLKTPSNAMALYPACKQRLMESCHF